jgi:ribonuclease Z
MTHEALQLAGTSIAGIETAIEVPSLKLVLDMGRCSRSAVKLPLVLVSHGHLDHLGALPQHAARRAMLKMPVPTYLVPAENAAAVERLFNAAGALDGQIIPRRVVPLSPGQDFELSATRFIRPFATFHRVPSQGYTVWERRTRLRAAFRGCVGAELARLRARGISVTEPHAVALLAFSGDTRSDVLHSVDELAQVQTLILEATFLDQRVSVADARSRGHIHLDELLACRALLTSPDIVLSHFSARYQPAEVERILTARLPEDLRARVRVLGAGAPSISPCIET